jgi:hypothetical protein
MLHGNEDLELVLLAGNFGHLLLVSIAVRLIVKTIGGIGPDKLDDFSLPRGDRRLRILRRIEPLFEVRTSGMVPSPPATTRRSAFFSNASSKLSSLTET